MPEGRFPKSRNVLRPMAMHERYGPLLRSFFARYFNPIRFPERAVEDIRSLAKKGTVIYLGRSASLLHFLYLNHICLTQELPLARFVNGVDPIFVQPVGLLLKRMQILGSESGPDLGEESDQLPVQQLASVLEAGESSLLFLDKPSTITSPGGADGKGLLKTLIERQLKHPKPIFLVPHLILWNRHPERESKALTDAIFGLHESPGFLRSLFLLLRYYRNALVKVAPVVDLLEFIQSQPDRNLPQLVKSLQEVLESRFSLEVFEVTGPRIRPPSEFKQAVLRDPKVEEFIASQSQGDETLVEELRKNAHDILDEIAAEPRIRWPLTVDAILNMFWKRMYEGFVVDNAGFEKIRSAIRKSPVVLCPSHKSHVDYLILSQLCIRHAIPLPHIAAGVNLSFWPMGPIFRHSGAFFMRRSFKGNQLYPVVFRTYLRHVMKEGFPIEFFIEGTRSRTGKLLSPRFGILAWLVQAYLEEAGEDLQFVPISIDYEKIVESRAYANELSGGAKSKENVAGLLKSRKALKSKYGKIYIQIADPISLKEHLRELGFAPANVTEEMRRSVVREMAYQILFEIGRVSTVTPSALLAFCLLTHRRRGISQESLIEKANWVADWIRRRGDSRFSSTLSDFRRSLAEAASRFSRDGLVVMKDTGFELVYAPVERRRLALDYYRNNIIHHFVPASICALALGSFTVEAIPREALSQRMRELSRLFKSEFLFRTERHFEQEVRRALNDLKSEGVVKEENGFVVKAADGQEKLNLFCAVLEHFVESYWLTARSLVLLRKGPMNEKDFVTRALHLGEHLYVQGELLLNESLNREVIQNAIKIFTDRKVILWLNGERRKGPRVSLLPPYDQPGLLEAIPEEIRRYLRR